MEEDIQRKVVLWKFDLCNPFCVLTSTIIGSYCKDFETSLQDLKLSD